jgi:hypothetical protein
MAQGDNTPKDVPEGYVICPECGGQGFIDARTLGEQGWHSCYHCAELGYVTKASDYDRLAAQSEAYEESQAAVIARLEDENKRLRAKLFELRTGRTMEEARAASEEPPF